MLARFFLIIAIACAMPLAIIAWVDGAHVTPEQRHAHEVAVARYGYHHHVAPAAVPDRANLLPLDGVTAGLGPSLPGVLTMFWHASALLSALVVVLALARGGSARRWLQQAPTSHQEAPLTRPPRPLAIV